jgi:hypothetical protein
MLLSIHFVVFVVELFAAFKIPVKFVSVLVFLVSGLLWDCFRDRFVVLLFHGISA